jgi:hypothetical protein
LPVERLRGIIFVLIDLVKMPIDVLAVYVVR